MRKCIFSVLFNLTCLIKLTFQLSFLNGEEPIVREHSFFKGGVDLILTWREENTTLY